MARRKSMALLALALAGPMWAGESDPNQWDFQDNNIRLDYGFVVNRHLNIADDGKQTEAYFVDSDSEESHAYLSARTRVNDDFLLGGEIYLLLQANPADSVSQLEPEQGLSTNARRAQIFAESRRWGTVAFGRGFASAFFISDMEAGGIDASGMGDYHLLSPGVLAGGLFFFDRNTRDYSNIQVKDPFLDVESVRQIDRLRYDSPAFNGLSIGATTGTDRYGDVTLRYRGNWGDLSVSAATTYQENASIAVAWRFDSGFGILHNPSGLNLTIAATRDEAVSNNVKGESYVIRPGWRTRPFEVGETRMFFDYAPSRDIPASGDDNTSYGAFVAQKFEAYNLDVYAGYRFYQMDRPSADLADIHVFVLGALFFYNGSSNVPVRL